MEHQKSKGGTDKARIQEKKKKKRFGNRETVPKLPKLTLRGLREKDQIKMMNQVEQENTTTI